jgi:PAS domain S-box-containing protein
MTTVTSRKPDLLARFGDAPFRLLADHLPALCFMADPEGRVVWCNQRWYDYTGITLGSDLERAWRKLHDPALVGEVLHRWSGAIALREAGEMVVSLRGADGRYRPFLTRAEPVQDAQGEVTCWLGTMTEITNQQEAERNQRFLVELGDALSDESDPGAILVATGRALAGHLGVARVGYGEIDADGSTIHASGRGWSDGSVPSTATTMRLADFGRVGAELVRRGKTCVFTDVETDPQASDGVAAHLAIGARAAVTVPLVKRGRLAALLCVHSSVPRAWRDAEIALIEDVADRTWAILERARAEAARRESDERLRLALEGAMLGTVEWDLATGRGRWSRRTCEIFGVESGEDITLDRLREIIHPDDRERVVAQIAGAVRSGGHYAAEYRIIRPQGGLRWVVSRARVQRNAEGMPVATVGLVMDITDRKLAEERLRESEARLRAIVEATPECVKIVGRDGRLAYMNRVGLDLVEAEEVEHVDIAELVAPEHRALWRANHARVCAGESLVWEFDIVGAKGTRRRMETHAVPLKTADGTVQQLAVTRDVTDRHRSEERLRESEALLAAFMKHAPIGMYLKDADGRYLLVNPEMAKVFGRPTEEVIGSSAKELFGETEAAMIAAHDAEILATGRPRAVEEFLPDLDDYGWSLVVRFPVSVEGEPPTRIGGFDIDITARKRAEEELERSREALYQTEKLTALGSLLAGVSHELNNPLSIVVTLSMLLEGQAKGTPLAERASKIRHAAERCAKIVQTFLAMARQRAPERVRVEANEVVQGAIDLADYGLRTAGIEVSTDLAAGLPPLWADPDQLHQVVLNLIVNAQQALHDKADERRLSIRTCAGERPCTVIIEIADNGPGIPPEARRRIFDPFFTTKPQGVGTGLGLSFSLGIAEAHGGTIRLCDVAGGGACFVIELPAAAVDHDATAPAVENRVETRGRALVVDDEPDLAEALAELLELEGLSVDTACSGRQAQLLIADHNYDVVLSDLRMPDLGGSSLYAWVQRERPHLADRMAFVTGDTLGPAAARFVAGAGRPVLEKPFGTESVRRLLAELRHTPAATEAVA